MNVRTWVSAASFLVMLTGVASQPDPAAAKRQAPFRVQAARYRAVVAFRVSYTGSGTFHTRYHSNPPNPGGKPDTNDANDASTQKWSIELDGQLALPPCGRPATGGSDLCARIKGLSGALGSTSATGSVQHRHIDGLFTFDNQSIACHVQARTPGGAALHAVVVVRYRARSRSVQIAAEDPVVDVLNRLPGACPAQGDPIDGLNDNYFEPGFSFANGWGPQRWLTSQTVTIPLSVLHRAALVTIPLHETPAGTPPRGCAVQHPAYETCTTGGAWSGALRLKLGAA